MRVPKIQAGVTLLELMTVIAVAGVLLGIAIPNMSQFLKNNRLTAAANDLLVALHTARSEAIKRRLPTQFCFTKKPMDDAPACDGNGTQGWVVWVDDADPAASAATDGNKQIDTGEPVLVRHEALPSSISVVSQPSGNAGYVAYLGSGFLNAAANDVAGIVLCDDRGNKALHGPTSSTARGLSISTTGRPAITRSVDTIKNDSTLLNNGACPP